MSSVARRTICKPAARRVRAHLNKSHWEVLRTGKGWVHLEEADDHVAALASIAAKLRPDEKVSHTIYESADKKLVLWQGPVCGLTEYDKNPEFYDDNQFHTKRVSLVRHV